MIIFAILPVSDIGLISFSISLFSPGVVLASRRQNFSSSLYEATVDRTGDVNHFRQPASFVGSLG